MYKYMIGLICIFVFYHAHSADSTVINYVGNEKKYDLRVTESKTIDSNLTKNQNQSGSDSFRNLMQVAFGLFVIIVLIAAVAWFTRKFGNFQIAAKGNLRIVGGLHLGNRERVVLIQVGTEQIVVGVAPGRVDKIHVLNSPVPIEENNPIENKNFALKLAEVIKGYTGK